MMECKDFQVQVTTYLEGGMDKDVVKEVESHLLTCNACQKVYQDTKELLRLMEQSPSVEAPLHQRAQFLANLQAEGAKLQPKKDTIVVSMPVGAYRIAAAVSLLLIGFASGWIINRTENDSAELTGLKTEVESMKQLVMMSMLSQTSASERIQAVGYVEQFDKPSLEVVETLFSTLNEDESPNVRMAALRALEKFAYNDDVRLMLIRSFEFQSDPVVQISLINLMVELEDKRAAKKFQQLIDNKDVTPTVRNQAKIGIQLLI